MYKTGSGDLVSNYQPFGLTSAVFRVMERVIRMASLNYMEGQSLLSRE